MIAMAPSTARKRALPSFTGFCVYVHRRASDGQVFYVGLGRRARVRQKAGRNPGWVETVARHGYTYEVVETFVTATQAAEREIELIAKYRNEGAPLVNRSQGGEGVAYWLTPAPDPIEAYRAAQAHGALKNRIDHWRETKLAEYKHWLKTYKRERSRSAKEIECQRRMDRYLASLQ